jgi:hypothetical protein
VGELHRHLGAELGHGLGAPSRPSTDNTGTLVDNGDGSYAYTFYRDITTVKSQLDGMTVSPPNNIADLGDVTYNPT